MVMLAPEDGELRLAAAWPPIDALEAGEMGAARWAFEKAEPAGWRTGTLPNVRFQFRPLVTPRGVVGVCGVRAEARRRSRFRRGTIARSRLILDQTAIAIDRALLVKAFDPRGRARGEREAAHDAAVVAVARSSHAARLDHRRRHDVCANSAIRWRRSSATICSPRSRRRRPADALRRQSPRYVAHRGGRAGSPAATGSTSPTPFARAAQRARKAFAEMKIATSVARESALYPRRCQSAASRCCSICSTMRINTAAAPRRRPCAPEGGNVVVTVTDEGPGVKPADLERIFEKFYRGGRPDGRKAGTGLGLSICRGLVEAMGGSIAAQSPALRRRGTRMVCGFRRPKRGERKNERRARSCRRRRTANPALSAPGAGRLAAMKFCRRKPAASALHADRQFARPTSSCSTSACRTWTASRSSRKPGALSKAPIVVLSARDREAEKIAALDVGADDYVEKPFAIGELLARLRAALRHAAGARPEKSSGSSATGW